MAETVVLLVVAVLLPTAAGYAVVVVRRLRRRLDERRSGAPQMQPIERVFADVRRLHNLLDTTENCPDLPAKQLRCTATRAAYVDALSTVCRQLELEPPSGRPVSRAEIYRVEADLRRFGLDVRAVG